MEDSEAVPPTIGERIAQARRALAVRLHRDVTQADVARALGVSSGAVSHWEKGTKVPKRGTVDRLGTLLGVYPGYLLFGTLPANAPIQTDLVLEWLDAGQKEPAAETPDPFGDGSDMGHPKLPLGEVEEAEDEKAKPKRSRRGKRAS